MKTTELLRYTRSILADEYAMQVLLYSIARTIVTNDYSLRGITSIRISAKFLAKSATIDITDRFRTRQNAFAVLLSLRALSLRPEWIKNCYNDSLLFGEFTYSRYEWVQYYTYIQECLSDNVFSLLFSLLQKTCSNAPLTKQDREAFVQAFPEPEYRNLIGFFQKFASTHTGVARECICNNALLCNDQITTYLVSPSVVYIGDTAFAYCSNLRRIQIQNPNTAFGRFPIIACDKLTHILVPEGTEEKFREALPYYKDIIFSPKTLAAYTADATAATSPSSVREEEQAPAPQPAAIDTQTHAIDTHTLKGVFANCTTSYKYFWFMALLTLADEKRQTTFTFDELVIRMASLAWPLVLKDQLSLGLSDRMAQYLVDVFLSADGLHTSDRNALEASLLRNYENGTAKKHLAPLLRNVPYRFLSPWIKYVSDKDVIACSNASTYTGPYALRDRKVILQKEWYAYLVENKDAVFDFIKQKFIAYLKPYNESDKLAQFRYNEGI